MNRQQRRANEASSRRPSQTQSFEQLVSQANRDALKPFIAEQVAHEVAMAKQEIARMLLDETARTGTRLMVLEKLAMEKLGESETTIAERVMVVEDEATGHTVTSEPAKQGDLVRCSLQVRTQGSDQFSRPQAVVIRALNTNRARSGSEPLYQTYAELEAALVGAKAGESREVTFPLQNGDVSLEYTFKVSVDRVSTPNLKGEVANAVS